MSTIEREGRYVQHNIGALPDDREDIEEFYLMAETEQRLEASKSTTSFQSFEMNQNRGSFSSQVYISTHQYYTRAVSLVGSFLI